MVTRELEGFLPNIMGVGFLFSLISLVVCFKVGLSDLEPRSVRENKWKLLLFILL